MPNRRILDKDTTIMDLGRAMRMVLRQGTLIFGAVIAGMNLYMWYAGYPGLLGFMYISIGFYFSILVWRTYGIGLPMVPVLAVQHFVVYGMPIFNNNETLHEYSSSLINAAGWELLVFLISMTSSWYALTRAIRPARGFAHVLTAFNRDAVSSLKKLGMVTMVASTAYAMLDFTGVLDAILRSLPSGTGSIAAAASSVASLAGFFLSAMVVGSGQASQSFKSMFSICFGICIAVALTSLLLYPVFGLIGAVCLGLFWSGGRVPWSFLVGTVAVVGFLQIGKVDMREHYLHSGDDDQSEVAVSLKTLPSFYANWANYSVNNIINTGLVDEKKTAKAVSLSNRIDNAQNLLFVMRAVELEHIEPLGGKTYSIIPALLTPRILWPEKPRTHEGQVMLNVYYGRQTEADSYTTYIAWGLLPEAYGNFGPLLGSLILGVFIGLFSAWIECFTALKPLLSLEGMCAFALLLGVALSFEMVASVLVTSQFQSMVTICLACTPFVRKLPVKIPGTASAA